MSLYIKKTTKILKYTCQNSFVDLELLKSKTTELKTKNK